MPRKICMDTDYNHLEHFPTFVFSQLINKWKNTNIKLVPNGLFSEENKEISISFLKDLSVNRINKINRMADTLRFTSNWWDVYQFKDPKPVSQIRLRPKVIDTMNYVGKDSRKINAKFSVIDLCEHAILLVIEFSSRTKALREIFRYLFLPSINKLMVEQKNFATELLKGELITYLCSSPETLTKKPIRARLIKKLAVSPDDPQHRLNISSLKIRISLETSGIEGLQNIIIEGENVIRGVETLEQRHEISLQFMQSGPWVGVGTVEFQMEIGKGVKIHQLESNAFKRLNTVLNWY
jgi:hypothetical protein